MENGKEEVQAVDLATLNPKNLPQLKGIFESQKQLVKDNPFIAIVDTKTHTEAKKRRTALVGGRTGITNQDKIIATYLKDFRKKVSSVTTELVDVTSPHEKKQQDEINRYEAEKVKAKAEKTRLEEERKQNILNSIDELFENNKALISELTFRDIEDFRIPDNSTNAFQEFNDVYIANEQKLDQLLSEKIATLQTKESQRVEALRLKTEADKLAKEKAEAKAKQDVIDAENKRIADENQRVADANKKESDRLAKIEADRVENNRLAKVEVDRVAKIETDRLAKIEADKNAKAKAEKEAKRIEALKPEKEKLKTIIDSIDFHHEDIMLSDKKAIEFRTGIYSAVSDLKGDLLASLSNL